MVLVRALVGELSIVLTMCLAFPGDILSMASFMILTSGRWATDPSGREDSFLTGVTIRFGILDSTTPWLGADTLVGAGETTTGIGEETTL